MRIWATVSLVLVPSIATTRLVRNTSLKGLYWKSNSELLGIEKVIDLLAESRLTCFLESQLTPNITSNSVIAKTIKLVGGFQFSMFKGQSLNNFLSLTVTSKGDTTISVFSNA